MRVSMLLGIRIQLRSLLIRRVSGMIIIVVFNQLASFMWCTEGVELREGVVFPISAHIN
jgi:hypothetical protein